MSVHAHIPAQAFRCDEGRARLGAVPSQVRWLLGGLVLAFGVPSSFLPISPTCSVTSTTRCTSRPYSGTWGGRGKRGGRNRAF